MRTASIGGVVACLFASGAVGLVACGGAAPPVSQAASASLSADLVQVEHAASLHDRAGAQAALTNLQHQVLADEASGQISRSRADQILHATAAVAGDLALIPTTTTTTAPPPPPAPAPHDHRHPGHGHGGGPGD